MKSFSQIRISVLYMLIFLATATGFAAATYELADSVEGHYAELSMQVDNIRVTKPERVVTLPKVATPVIVKNVADITRNDGKWVLVNKTKRLPLEYIPAELVPVTVPHRNESDKSSLRLHTLVKSPLETLFADAKKAGHTLMVSSAYRSASLQQTYFNEYVSTRGLAIAERYSAHPGASEHQTGLAVDVSTENERCYAGECYIGAAASKWIADNAHRYGFVVRYQKGKEDITGYNYEPWHLRYFGEELATALHSSGMVYEEVVPYLLGEKEHEHVHED
ncbi:M15 family metallopeptidase [Candidatus Saccharibacteria bacterium]|nr:M15 family metallopeptidase [Candidatus Saccharibacteria bacterium]